MSAFLETQRLSVVGLLKSFPWRVGVTWLLVLLETGFFALIPLLLAQAIDGLIAASYQALWQAAGALIGLTVLGVIRRFYDTRAYGAMRIALGQSLLHRLQSQEVSSINARLDMSRELVDFLEAHVPELFTALVQLLVSIIILFSYDIKLGVFSLLAMALCISSEHARQIEAKS